MPAATAASVRLSAWLNAARRGEVTGHDAANACETISGQLEISGRSWLDVVGRVGPGPARPALPEPGDPWGVPIAGALEAVAASPSLLLVRRAEWQAVDAAHAVPVIDAGWARRNLLAEVSDAADLLERSATLGDRDAADEALQRITSQWPPTLAPRAVADLELATRLLVASELAADAVTVPSSPSQYSAVRTTLLAVSRASRLLMCAAVST